MLTRELIVPDGLKNLYTEKGYAPGVRVGNMLYVSGMLGRDKNLNVIKDLSLIHISEPTRPY